MAGPPGDLVVLAFQGDRGLTVSDARLVGIPRALLYHKYRPLWTTFFEGIGWNIVTSAPTNRRLIERGSALAVDESCLSLKVFLGHVESLRGHCDVVFVPRIESLHKSEHLCVNFMGAYDVVRNTMPDLRIVTYNVDVANAADEEAAMFALARELGAGRREARRAYTRARAAQAEHDRESALLQTALLSAVPNDADGVRILVVGHSYNLADEYIGKPIVRYLQTLGAEVITSDAVDRPHARTLSAALSPSIKWTYNKELLGAIELYRGSVDGIVFIVTFPCGPDSLMVELCQRRIEGIPIATLVIDELEAEAGLRTRLESFVDILDAKRRTAALCEACS